MYVHESLVSGIHSQFESPLRIQDNIKTLPLVQKEVIDKLQEKT